MTNLPDYRIYGQHPVVIYILHGIFGMKDNWHYVAGKMSENYTVVTLDARNHGKSFHSADMSYALMAEDLARLMDHLGHSRAHIMGHSMGGKTAMTFSKNFPDKISKLIIVDIALRAYPPGHIPYFQAFESIDFTKMGSRSEAEAALLPYAPDLAVRQFLLKNLEPAPGGGYRPRFNLQAIKSFYDESIGSIHLPVPCWMGDTALIYGGKSPYVTVQDRSEFKSHYPNCHFIEIEGAGHWVHADKPSEFIYLLEQFLSGN